jgi:hypothetical protein
MKKRTLVFIGCLPRTQIDGIVYAPSLLDEMVHFTVVTARRRPGAVEAFNADFKLDRSRETFGLM